VNYTSHYWVDINTPPLKYNSANESLFQDLKHIKRRFLIIAIIYS